MNIITIIAIYARIVDRQNVDADRITALLVGFTSEMIFQQIGNGCN